MQPCGLPRVRVLGIGPLPQEIAGEKALELEKTEGTFKGRKKEQIITPGGIKIHPEVIEQEINGCPLVMRSVAFLRPGAANLTCVIDLIQPEAADAKTAVRKHINAMRSTRGAFQFVEILFAETPFSVENGMLRPNMKLDRKAIAAKYGASRQ